MSEPMETLAAGGRIDARRLTGHRGGEATAARRGDLVSRGECVRWRRQAAEQGLSAQQIAAGSGRDPDTVTDHLRGECNHDGRVCQYVQSGGIRRWEWFDE